MQESKHVATEFSQVQQAVLQTVLRWEEQAPRSRSALQEELQLWEVLTEQYSTNKGWVFVSCNRRNYCPCMHATPTSKAFK